MPINILKLNLNYYKRMLICCRIPCIHVIVMFLHMYSNFLFRTARIIDKPRVIEVPAKEKEGELWQINGKALVENGDSKVEAEFLSVLFNFTATMRAIILICHLKSNLLFLLLFYLWQPVIMKHCVYLLYFVLWYHIKKTLYSNKITVWI